LTFVALFQVRLEEEQRLERARLEEEQRLEAERQRVDDEKRRFLQVRSPYLMKL